MKTTQTIYVFGYGSLMNPRSLAITLPGERITKSATLKNYQRICNMAVNGYSYLNVQREPGFAVGGKLVPVTRLELDLLIAREAGYDCVDVSSDVPGASGKVFTFIAKIENLSDLRVPRSYLLTCTSGMDTNDRDIWIEETIILNGIEEDLDSPVYANYVSDDYESSI